MSRINDKNVTQIKEPKFPIAKPHDLSPRSQWLRYYYFKGVEREWNNQYMPFTTGTDWDLIFEEANMYIVPEAYLFFGNKGKGAIESSMRSMAPTIKLPESFWELSLPERRVIFFEKAMLDYIPQEIISENDLIAGGRFQTQLSKTFTEKEAKNFWKENLKNRRAIFKFHNSGFGNLGAIGGHLIPDYETIIKKGFKVVYEKAKSKYEQLSQKEKKGPKGQELRSIIRTAKIPKKLAKKYYKIFL